MGAFEDSLLHIQHVETTGTNGGTGTSDTFVARPLNTVLTNEISGASLGSNQITLPAGTYFIKSSSIGYLTREYATLLYDTTGSSTLIEGTSDYSTEGSSGAPDTVVSHIYGRFTLGVTSVLEVRFGMSHSTNSQNFGRRVGSLGGNVDQETYADVRIWKVD